MKFLLIILALIKIVFCFTESAPQEAQYIYNTLEVLGKDKSISLEIFSKNDIEHIFKNGKIDIKSFFEIALGVPHDIQKDANISPSEYKKEMIEEIMKRSGNDVLTKLNDYKNNPKNNKFKNIFIDGKDALFRDKFEKVGENQVLKSNNKISKLYPLLFQNLYTINETEIKDQLIISKQLKIVKEIKDIRSKELKDLFNGVSNNNKQSIKNGVEKAGEYYQKNFKLENGAMINKDGSEITKAQYENNIISEIKKINKRIPFINLQHNDIVVQSNNHFDRMLELKC